MTGYGSFIANDNPSRATSFVLELKEAAIKLQVHPGMGRAGRVPGTRELVLHKNYIAIYRVRGAEVQKPFGHHKLFPAKINESIFAGN